MLEFITAFYGRLAAVTVKRTHPYARLHAPRLTDRDERHARGCGLRVQLHATVIFPVIVRSMRTTVAKGLHGLLSPGACQPIDLPPARLRFRSALVSASVSDLRFGLPVTGPSFLENSTPRVVVPESTSTSSLSIYPRSSSSNRESRVPSLCNEIVERIV